MKNKAITIAELFLRPARSFGQTQRFIAESDIPKMVGQICDLDSEKVPDLSDLDKSNKDEFIKEFVEMTAKNVLSVFVALGLKTHIEATVVNDADGNTYKLSFKKSLTEQPESVMKAKIKDIWYGGHNFAKGCGLTFEHWYSLNKEKLQSNPITDSGGVSDVIEQIKEIVEYTPELNMGNYNDEDVKCLDDAITNIHNIILEFKQSHPTPEISEGLIDPKQFLEEQQPIIYAALDNDELESIAFMMKSYHIFKTKGAKPMSDDWISMLREFHKSFNLPLRDIPQEIPPKEFELRHNLLQEEVNEISIAYSEIDLKEIFDGILDSIYVLIGTAVQMGFGDVLNAGFKEVHRSNMSKLGDDGKPILREDGKVMKGANFTKPNFEQFL